MLHSKGQNTLARARATGRMLEGAVFLIALFAVACVSSAFVIVPSKAIKNSNNYANKCKVHRASHNTCKGNINSLPRHQVPLRTSQVCVTSCLALNDIFMLSFDGTVANTSRSRASLAVDVAIATWAHLESLVAKDDIEWLLNKMTALSHVTCSCNDGLLGCYDVLLARLLIEEQRLDAGRSVGNSGKYASRFHPRTELQQREHQVGCGSGSRPLTVGEIAANWNEGALLCETLTTRYKINGVSPLPTIKENILKLQNMAMRQGQPQPTGKVHPAVAEALVSCSGTVLVLLGHSSQVGAAVAALSDWPICVKKTEPDISATAASFSDDVSGKIVTFVTPTDENETQVDVIERLMKSSQPGRTFYLIHSGLTFLQNAKQLLGDDSPYAKKKLWSTKLGATTKLSLILPTWADNTDPEQHRRAEMDPWINLMDATEFGELLSAKITQV